MNEGRMNNSSGYVSKSTAGKTEFMTNIIEEKGLIKKLIKKIKTKKLADNSRNADIAEESTSAKNINDDAFIIIKQDKSTFDKKIILGAGVIVFIVIAASIVIVFFNYKNKEQSTVERVETLNYDPENIESNDEVKERLESTYENTRQNYSDGDSRRIESVQHLANFYFDNSEDAAAMAILDKEIAETTDDTALSYYYETYYAYYLKKGDKEKQLQYLQLLVDLPENTSRYQLESWGAVRQSYEEELKNF